MSMPRFGDLYRYTGKRRRRALPLATIIEAKPTTGRYRLCHTYAAGPVRERRTWIRGATLRKNYELVGRQETVT